MEEAGGEGALSCNNGAGIGKFKRALLVAAYDRRCWICGARPEMLTMDHIIPRMDGGGNELENLRPACARCNVRRAARLDRMFGRGRRDAITLDIANTWWRLYPLPRFNRHGQLEWVDAAHLDRHVGDSLNRFVKELNRELSRAASR